MRQLRQVSQSRKCERNPPQFYWCQSNQTGTLRLTLENRMKPLFAAISLFTAMAALLPINAMAENSVEDWSWIVDHYEQDGPWISACDHRDDAGKPVNRCYVSLVEVYAPRPQFGAAFVFVTSPEPTTLEYEFRFEKGTVFESGGFAVQRDGKPVWSYDTANCPDLRCIVKGSEANELATIMRQPGEMTIAFKDVHGRDWKLQWPLAGFGAMLDDFRKAATQRGL